MLQGREVYSMLDFHSWVQEGRDPFQRRGERRILTTSDQQVGGGKETGPPPLLYRPGPPTAAQCLVD